MIRLLRVAVWLLGAALLAGCSGLKTYPDTSPKNLFVKTEASSGSAFARVRVAVHIHQVDANCRAEYLGTVQLNESSVQIGIPVDRLSFLEFSFFSSSFLGGSSGTIHYTTLLRPRAGHTYDASARYADGIYHVVIRESDPRQRAGREIERRGLDECGRRG
jgi:hypothetical protein